jgi:hypothetical protein
MPARQAVLRSEVMAKFKAARPGKSKRPAPAQGALPCVILVLLGVFLVSLMLYFALRSSG